MLYNECSGDQILCTVSSRLIEVPVELLTLPLMRNKGGFLYMELLLFTTSDIFSLNQCNQSIHISVLKFPNDINL